MEIWKNIDGYEGLYQVSSLGNVKSLERHRENSVKLTPGRILKGILNDKGYYSVRLYKNKKPNFHSVSRLVAQTFIRNPKNKPEVNHISGNTKDNSVTNLEWVTHAENMEHAVNTGLMPKGEQNARSKIKECDVKNIREMYAKGGISTRALSEKFNIGKTAIWQIVTNQTWKHVS